MGIGFTVVGMATRWARAALGIGFVLVAAAAPAAEGAEGPSAIELGKIPEALPGAPPLSLELRRKLAGELARRGADYEVRSIPTGVSGNGTRLP